MKNIITLLTVLLLSSLATSQDEGKFWYFGTNAGLDFSTSPPTPLNNGSLDSFEGCSTISDDIGNLLFYTDGTTIWNKNHIPMPDGTGLSGNASSAQSSTIIKVISSTNLYYVFTISAASGLQYSLINMTLDNGLGNIVPGRKNIPIQSSTQEKVSVTLNLQGDGYWIVTFNDPTYTAYRASGGVIDIANKVDSTLPVTSSLSDQRGMLKFSPPDGSS
ncbi:hypothetical protein JCM19297_3746 [Nonlabens ulvanivorans]|nr:hypothetical protein [Nonlabens ulvanivorans]GAK91799.1 hypothetical protein JCM19297_3746 [Nonlabens ulvanivorans]